ncbi:AraC family ligand binding domain-containing protein [Flammeovirgaceae bacterium SG7u.111]|nr:AraC family ligand binding domain-containing protein [Flammeovirgaceae bacterium SG7u.132]WPO34259.1 AraC family ligand binding domain-containing protein [Flammeovirgaceae bacterium SG7u.111]
MSFEIKDKTAPKEGIKISPFRKNIRKTNPHKHNSYFEIVYLTGGKGVHTIDMQEFDIAPPICFVVRKEQVHFWNILSEPEGFVLIIKKAFIDSCLDKEILQLVSKISAFPCIYPKQDGIVEQIFQLLMRIKG